MKVKIFTAVLFTLFWVAFGCLDLKIENSPGTNNEKKRNLKCHCTKKNSTGGSEHIHEIQGNYHKYIGNKEAIVDITNENRFYKTYQCVYWNSDKENRFAVLSDEIKLMEKDSQPIENQDKVFHDMTLVWYPKNKTKSRIDEGDLGTIQCAIPYHSPPSIELGIYQRIGSRINVIQTCTKTPCQLTKKMQKSDINSILYCLYYPNDESDENSYYSRTYRIDEAMWNNKSSNLGRSNKANLYKIGILSSILFLLLIVILVTLCYIYKICRDQSNQVINHKPLSNLQPSETVVYAEIEVMQTNNNVVLNNNQTPYAQIVGVLKPKNK